MSAPPPPPFGGRLRRCAARACALGSFIATAACAAGAPPLLSVDITEPRAFGYQVGDVVSGTVLIHIPTGLALDESSVPKPGARGKALELRSVVRSSATEPGGQRLALTLDYQVFLSPAQTRTLETPALNLRFTGQPREQALRIEPWPVTVAPLAPADVSPRRGLGELQPDAAPPSIATTAVRWRLAAEGGVALLLLGYLAHVYLGAPWWARSRRPFNLAWRDLRALPIEATPGEQPPSRAAIQRLHEALNASAGEVVFEAGIERFVSAQPRFGHLRDDLVAFLRRSNREFFAIGALGAPSAAGAPGATTPVPDGDSLAWLLAFCRRCRDAERGAA